MGKHKHRAELEQQIAELRKELDQLRASLQDGTAKLRVAQINVADDDFETSIYPYGVGAHCREAATVALLEATWEGAVVAAWSSPDHFTVPRAVDGKYVRGEHHAVELWAENPVEGMRRVYVTVDGVELAVPQPVS